MPSDVLITPASSKIEFTDGANATKTLKITGTSLNTDTSFAIGATTANNTLSVLGSASIGSSYNVAGPTNGLIVQGNVGIGINSPSNTKLHIVGDWVSGHSTVKVQGITDNTTGYGFYDTAGSRLGYLAYTGAAFEWYNNANVPVIFYTNTSERMRIAADGKVGIGTTSPASKLEVKGVDDATITAIFQSTAGGNAAYNGGIQLGNAASSQNSQIYHDSSGDNTLTFKSNYASGTGNKFVFAPGGTERVRFQQNGNVGLGITSPNASLHIKPTTLGANGFILERYASTAKLVYAYESAADGYLEVRSGADVIVSKISGYVSTPTYFQSSVGVGTASPSNKVTIEADATGASFADNSVGQLIIRGATNTAKRLGLGIDTTNNVGVIQAQLYGTGQYPLALNPAGGYVGIGTTSPTQKLDIVGSYATAGDSSGILKIRGGATGGDTQLNFGVSADGGYGWIQATDVGITNNINIVLNPIGGNVGIGATVASAKLHVAGTTGLYQSAGSTYLYYDHSGVNTWRTGIFTDNTSSYIIGHDAGGTFATKILTITMGGNVGIGTTNPSSSLHVSKAGNTSGGTILMGLSNDGAAKWSYLVSTQYNSSSNAKGFSLIGGYTDASSNIVAIGGSIYEANPATELQFYTHTAVTHATGGTRRMTINTNGNVGIGYTNPAYLLDVNGVARVNGNFNITSGGDLGIFDSDGTGAFYSFMDAGVGYIRIDDGGTANGKLDINNSLLYIQQAGGNVGVGTNNPTSKLHVWNGTVRVSGFQSIAAGPLTFLRSDYNGSAAVQINFLNINPSNGYDSDLGIQLMNTAGSMVDVMRVKGSTGNVGIGVINPLAQLHINEATSGAAALRVDGTNGTLFSVIDDLSDSLMSVNNSAGLPVLEVFADDRVVMGQYGTNDLVVRNNKIGVGTSLPSSQLEVGNVNTSGSGITVSARYDQSEAYIRFRTGHPNNSNVWETANISATDGGNYNGTLSFRTAVSGQSSPSTKMTILPTGNVGINNTNPVFKLDVNGTSGFRDSMAFGPSVGLISWGSMGGGTGFGMRAESGRALSLGANGSFDHIVINTSGNVGVGTTGPIARLHVYDTNQSPATGNLLVTSTGGNASIRIDSNSTSNYTYFTLSQGGTGRFELGIVPTSSDFYINPTVQSGANGAAIYVKKADGNVGINSTSPNSPLTVYNNSDVWHFRLGGASGELRMGGQTNSGAVIQAYTPGGSVRDLYLQRDGGNVGIGTNSPSRKLHVYSSGLSDNTVNPLLLIDGKFTAAGVDSNDIVGIAFRVENSAGGSQTTTCIGSSYQGAGNALLLQPVSGNVGVGTINPSFKFEIGAGSSNVVVAKLTQGYERVRYNGFDLLGYNDGNLWMMGNNATNTILLSNNWDWDYQVGIAYTPGTVGVAGGSLEIGQLTKNNANFTHGNTRFYTNGVERLRIISNGYVGIGASSPTYKLQIGTVGSLADSIRIGTYLVAKNTRQYIGYTRDDSGLFESAGDGDTPATVKGGVAGIRIVNTTGTLASAYADNSVQLLTHIFNGGSRVVLHANYDGNVGIGTSVPAALLQIGTGSPTSATGGLQFGDDTGARLYRSASGIVTCSGSIEISANGSLNGNYGTWTGEINKIQWHSNNLYFVNRGGGSWLFRNSGGSNVFSVDANGGTSVSGYLSAATYVYATTYLQTNGNLIYPSGYGATLKLEVGNPSSNAWIDGLTLAPGGNVVIAGTLTESSSIRYKENIETISAPILSKLNKIRPVTYNKKDNPNNIEYGIIAEELNELFPEFVNKNESGEVESVNYSRLTVILIKAVKELQEEVEKLKNK